MSSCEREGGVVSFGISAACAAQLARPPRCALREDQTTLNALAIEMRQSRFREMQDRNEQAEMLSATWTKQKALKDMERALGKK